MSKLHLYSVWAVPNPKPNGRGREAYHCAKYDRETLFEEEKMEPYVTIYYPQNKWYKCTCPGFMNYRHCRHQEITKIFVDANKVGSGQLYDYDNRRWTNYSA